MRDWTQMEASMTRKLIAVLLAATVLLATPVAGVAAADTAGNTSTDDGTDGEETTENETEDNETLDDNETENETEAEGVFGQQVSLFVDDLKDNETTAIGPMVAAFVVANNLGNAPDHAGPPAWVTDDNETKEPGPPGHAGPDGNDTQGPPSDAGPDEGTQGPPEDGERGPSDDEDRRGPPENAGHAEFHRSSPASVSLRRALR